MSDSISHNAVSNDAFEALIDLLASDDINECSSKHQRTTQSNLALRDPSGKLDFNKIRLMFAAQNGTVLEESSATPHEDAESDDEYHSHRSTSESTAPSRPNSMSPKPANRVAPGHRRSSTFGNQPLVAIQENATLAKQDKPLPLLDQPLSFEELNAALAGAHEEVKSLRQQYDELLQASKRLGTDQAKFSQTSVNDEKVNGHAILPSASPLPDLPVEIAKLSEDEAKRVLDALVGSLNLSSSIVGSMLSLSTAATPTSPKHHVFPRNPMQQHDVASIARSLKFLGTVDELVWRRTSALSGPRTLPSMFSEENVVALLARLELWERAVRRSTRG